MGQIYKITNIINKKCYIGQTLYDANKRFKEHINASTNTRKNNHFYNAIRKYGIENFELEILENNVAEDKLDELEIYYIKKYDSYNNGYNSTIGGHGVHGIVFTDEVLQKKSNSMKAKWKNKNIPLTSKERNLKISQINKGKPKSIEHRKKLSDLAKQRIGDKNAFYGKKHTKETIQKISNSNSKTVYMYDINMNYIQEFKNGKLAAIYLKKLLNLDFQEQSIYRGINWACIKDKPYKNYYFKYYKV